MNPFSPDSILQRLAEKFPAGAATLVNDTGAAAQHSLLLDNAHAAGIAIFLRDDPALRLDYCSNVTGMDWLKKGFLEAVYHLYSMEKKSSTPVILRLRTNGRGDDPAAVTVPSLTPVWRSCELQEREIYDLYGIIFSGHPDLRRLLMWDEFKDFPMRKDYVPPDDDATA